MGFWDRIRGRAPQPDSAAPEPLLDPDRDEVWVGQPYDEGWRPPADWAPLEVGDVLDRDALGRLLQVAGPVYDPDGKQLDPTVPAELYLAGHDTGSAYGARSEAEMLRLVVHLREAGLIRSAWSELNDHDAADEWPHSHTLLLVTRSRPATVLSWFHPVDEAAPDSVTRLSAAEVRREAFRGDSLSVPDGHAVVRCWWD